eukprot:s4683_g1.t1
MSGLSLTTSVYDIPESCEVLGLDDEDEAKIWLQLRRQLRRGAYSAGLGLATRLVAADVVALCVAGVALGDMNLHFVLQAWGLVTSPFTLCGKRVALGDVNLHFVWQAWGLVTSASVLRDRHGTHGRGLGAVTALVAAGPLWRRVSFTWQEWRLATSAFVLWQGWRLATSAIVLCGRRAAQRHWADFGGGLGRRWTPLALRLLSARHSRRWAGSGGDLGRGWSPVPVAPHFFCVAGVALFAFVLCDVGVALVAMFQG